MSHQPTNRRHVSAFLFIALLLGATQLSAGESRWYVESRLGQTDLEAQFGTRWPKFFDGEHAGASIEAGYSLNRYLGVQVGYHDLGEYTGFGVPCREDEDICFATLGDTLASSTELCADLPCDFAPVALSAEVSGLSLSVVPRYPFNDRVSVYGKLGVIDWDSDVAEVFDSRPIQRYSDRDLLTGIGVQYTFPKGLGILAEYQHLDLDAGSTSLGASWRF